MHPASFAAGIANTTLNRPQRLSDFWPPLICLTPPGLDFLPIDSQADIPDRRFESDSVIRFSRVVQQGAP